MNVGKFILNIVVAYILFAVLYTVAEMYIIADQMEAMKALMKPEEETMVVYLYYLVETIVFVWLFNKVVGSDNMKDAAVYGAMIGFYVSAAGAVMFATVNGMPEGMILPTFIMNVINSALVAMGLAFMWGKGWGSGASAAE